MKTVLGHRQTGHEVQHRSSPPKRDTVNKSFSSDAVQPVHGPTESPDAGVTRGLIALGTPLDVGDASRDDPTATTPVVRAMSTAGKGIVDAMADPERTGAPDFRSDAQVTGELLHRARCLCEQVQQLEPDGAGETLPHQRDRLEQSVLSSSRILHIWHSIDQLIACQARS